VQGEVGHVAVVWEGQSSAREYPPVARAAGHVAAFRNEIEAQLTNCHLIGHWKNSSDTRYFGSLHLAVLPGETVMEGYYTGYSSDIEVSVGRWKWVRLDPVSLSGVDLSEVTLREPRILYGDVENHTQYDAPLSLNAVVEET